MIITIDGPAASGKGTLANLLAETLGFSHLATGYLYRCIGLCALRAKQHPISEIDPVKLARNIKPEDLSSLLKDPAFLGDEVGKETHRVAAISEVREALLDFQRQFALNPPRGTKGAILDGRDISTIVCPNADVKFFLTADLEIRAQRRLKDLQKYDPSIEFKVVLENMAKRDLADSTRENSPLRPSEDAFIIDTSYLDINQVYQLAMFRIHLKRSLRYYLSCRF